MPFLVFPTAPPSSQLCTFLLILLSSSVLFLLSSPHAHLASSP